MNSAYSKIEAINTPLTYINLDDPIAGYRGNPLIGALGPVRTAVEIGELLTVKPRYDPSERNLPPHLRTHAAFALREFFLPGIPHMAAVKEVDLLIRQSYRYRNPLDLKYRVTTERDIKALKEGRPLSPRYEAMPPLGATVIGPPGMGKTMSIGLGVKDIPAVVEHTYLVDGVRITFKQVPYLKINLFQDGSLKAFGLEIFEQAEQTLSVPLARDWGLDRATGNRIQSLYFQLCREYNVGLFILDEFQLIQAAHDGTKKALSYFVRLMNCIGVALIVIGTSATSQLLKENMAASRRFLSSIPPFTPFVAGAVWDAFFLEMARYQYVAKMDDIPKLSKMVLELSGGIPDLAVKLFLLSQIRLFGKQQEFLDCRVIEQTSALLFSTVQDRLVELKGRAPEKKGLEDAVKKVDAAFAELTNIENERVKGAPIAMAPTKPIELFSTEENTIAGKILAAAKNGDSMAALTALGVIADPK
jgi:hypothetical protein